MSPSRETRTFPLELELRSDGRTLVGIAVPWDERIDRPMPEVFRRGAFSRSIRERGPRRVKVLAQHDDRSLPIGRAEVLREDPAGLYCELRISDTTAGNDALALVRDGAVDGLSVGFSPVEGGSHRLSDGTVERREVRLHEISVCTWPAYDNARILATRTAVASPDSMPLAHARRLARLL